MRFQELETDASDNDGVTLGRRGFAGDELQFTGYDLGSGKQRTYDDQVYRRGYEYEEDEDEYEEEGEWQLALKEKEDELVDRAMRRIKRARLKGESEVDLSREEIDALERRKNSQQVAIRKTSQEQVKQQAVAKTSKSKKKSGGGFMGFGAQPPKPKSARASPKQLPPPEDRAPSGRNSPDLYGPDPRSIVPAGYMPPPPRQPASPRASRASSRPSSRTRQQPSPPTSYYGYDPRLYPGADPSIRPVSASSRNSDTRSLPDDPDWHPRSRSSSSAHLYAQGVDPMAYETGRRNISGPPTVSYSSLRRAPPQNTRGGPSSPDPNLNRSTSGLSNEVIEISSDEDEDESDEGVRVDTAPVPTGYTTSPRGPLVGRARRGGRR